MSAPLRIFVGSEPKTRLAYLVLKHTIEKYASRPVEVTEMIGPRWEYSTQYIKVGTGFSLRRWMIPSRCNWEGEALYLDADQQVFEDIYKILEGAKPAQPGDNPIVFTTYQPDKFNKKPWPQTSVMAINCKMAKGLWGFDIDQILFHLKKRNTQIDYANFMHGTWLPVAPGILPIEWNHLNVYKEGQTKLLHYTKEPEQPWYKPDHPFARLWQQALEETIKSGVIKKGEFISALEAWNVKEDWRPTNGLHPYYKKYLPLFQ